jgi:hypothetical protein
MPRCASAMLGWLGLSALALLGLVASPVATGQEAGEWFVVREALNLRAATSTEAAVGGIASICRCRFAGSSPRSGAIRP